MRKLARFRRILHGASHLHAGSRGLAHRILKRCGRRARKPADGRGKRNGHAAPVVGLSATGLAFPNENVNVTSPSQAVTLTNTGNATLNIASIVVAGTNAADFTSSNNCGTTLAASAMCTITTTFTPAAAGSRSATITLTDDAADSPESISLSGQGLLAATATLSASSLTFSQQLVGATSSAQAVTLTNNGNAALAITSIAASGANAADFAVTNNCGASLAASAQCSIGATFTPAASGSRSAAITVTDSASGSPQSIALSGTGQDFSLSFASPTATVTAGNAANLQLSITPLAGFSQTITLSCMGAPSLTVCVVTPSSVTPTGAAVTVTVTLSTAGQILTMRRYSPPSRPTGVAQLRMLLLIALCIVALGFSVRPFPVAQAARYVSRGWVFGSLVLFVALSVASCTGTVSAPITPKTPAGTLSDHHHRNRRVANAQHDGESHRSIICSVIGSVFSSVLSLRTGSSRWRAETAPHCPSRGLPIANEGDEKAPDLRCPSNRSIPCAPE